MAESDIVQIKQLGYRYAYAVDACDLERFLGAFTENARIHIYHPDAEEPFTNFEGYDELSVIPGRMKDMFAQTMHVMTNHLVEVDGDDARGTVLCTSRHLTKDRENSMNVMIRYIDRYVRVDGAWLIADREIRFLWSEQHAAIDSGFGQ